jgi:hypothetical protein
VTAKRAHYAPSLIVLALAFLIGVPAFLKPAGAFLEAALVARFLVAFGLPLAAATIYFLFRSLWEHDRVRTGNGAFQATYQAIVFRVIVFVVAMHTLLVVALTDTMDVIGSHTWGKRVVVVMFGLMFVAVGNLLPRTRPNIAFGVRTARTLANTHLWQRVHRIGGYTTVGLGVTIIVAGLVISNKAAGGFVLLACGVASAIVYVSYRKYASA